MTEMEEIFYGLELHCLKWNNYFENYERHLSKFKGENPRVLEIGVKCGGGIELLHKYFGGGKFYGIDCWVDSTEIDFAKHGIDCTMFLGDQGDPDWWNNWLKENPNLRFDVIVDDGSHNPYHQWMSLVTLFPLLKEDGVYIIEDTLTSYAQGVSDSINFFKEYLPKISKIMHHPFVDKQELKSLVAEFPETLRLENLNSYSVYCSQIVFDKRFQEIPETVYSDGKDHLFPKNSRTIWGIIEEPNGINLPLKSNDDANKNTNQWEF